MDYVVLDLETANPDYASICQIGYVIVRNDQIADQKSILVDRDDYFDAWNIAIHGITADHVKGAPKFNEIHGRLCAIGSTTPIVPHREACRSAAATGRDLSLTSPEFGKLSIVQATLTAAVIGLLSGEAECGRAPCATSSGP